LALVQIGQWIGRTTGLGGRGGEGEGRGGERGGDGRGEGRGREEREVGYINSVHYRSCDQHPDWTVDRKAEWTGGWH